MVEPTREQIELAHRMKLACDGEDFDDVMVVAAGLVVRAALRQSCSLGCAADRVEELMDNVLSSMFKHPEITERLLGRRMDCTQETPPGRRH